MTQKQRFKKAIHWLHLWLGLACGAVVVVVGLTGCLYVFAEDIIPWTASYQRAPVPGKEYVLPSQLVLQAEKALPGKKVRYIDYEKGRSAYVGLYGEGYNIVYYANPYTGEKLHISDQDREFNFFDFVLDGHRCLWLPYNIGSKIVDASVLILLFMLISGLVLWWPKNWKKANRNKSFKVRLSATVKRLNYDLHNVLGFYAVLPLFVIAATGLAWGYEWFDRMIYFAASAGKEYPKYIEPVSDTLSAGSFSYAGADRVYTALHRQYPHSNIAVFLPEKRSEPLQFGLNHCPGKNYDRDFLFFDQVSLKPLPGAGVFRYPFSEAPFADKVGRFYYDLHTGQIASWPTKILALFASLICASLPVTGFFIWWNRRNKKAPRVVNRDV